ncbi:MAG: hypothetical protein WD072_11535 [Pirellulales bacterium]
MVDSGGTRREDLTAYAYRPDMVVDSIADLSAADLAGIATAGNTAATVSTRPRGS